MTGKSLNISTNTKIFRLVCYGKQVFFSSIMKGRCKKGKIKRRQHINFWRMLVLIEVRRTEEFLNFTHSPEVAELSDFVYEIKKSSANKK